MKILICRPDKLGDVTLALHGIKQLRRSLPAAKIYLQVAPYSLKLVENIKFLDGIITTEDKIKKGQFDIAIDLIAKYRFARNLHKVKTRIGNAARGHSFWSYTKTRYIRRSRALINEAEYNWELISLSDPVLRYSRLTESLEPDDFKSVVEYTKHQDYIVLMPSITVSAVGWELKNWLALAEKLKEKYSQKIIFLLGPAEAALEEEIRFRRSDQEQILVEKFPGFPELLGFLKNCKYYIGTSTGVTHLASAMGAEGIAMYPLKQSMHPKRWQPFNTKLRIITLNRKLTPEIVADSLSGEIPDYLNPFKRDKISAFVICKNESKSMHRALDSIKWCDETVVVDNGSTDNTLAIAKNYTDKVFYHNWTGYRDQKAFALSLCSNSWVLNIDADEEVSMQLRGEIEQILRKKAFQAKGYQLSRLIYFLNKWWDKGGWFPEHRLRFFRKDAVEWCGNDPHEKAKLIRGKPRKLRGHIYHYTYRDFEHQKESLKKHAIMMANTMNTSGVKCRSYNIIANPCFRFVKFYILKKGFLEGLKGWSVAREEAYYTYLKYSTLKKLQNKEVICE